ncbi:hypothetical protein EDB85DRAFT_1965615, partial [Lactarius pseudohatsudake]
KGRVAIRDRLLKLVSFWASSLPMTKGQIRNRIVPKELTVPVARSLSGTPGNHGGLGGLCVVGAADSKKWSIMGVSPERTRGGKKCLFLLCT